MDSEFYKKSGVDVLKTDDLVNQLSKTPIKNPNILKGIGGFASLFSLDLKDYTEPVLVSATDGVGTKLEIADFLNRHDTVGIDLVAMCVNDLITYGAKPLFFLDYFASSKIQADTFMSIINGIRQGCDIAEIELVGGETAEMPGFYVDRLYDLAGFVVGIVDKKSIIDGSKICVGDYIIGFPSSGFHSNGYSLIRKILRDKKLNLSMSLPFEFVNKKILNLGQALLIPTRIYVPLVQSLLKAKINIKGMAHITGGGLLHNIQRILPEGFYADLNPDREYPVLFSWFQTLAGLSKKDMECVFNTGIGLVLIASQQEYEIIKNKYPESIWMGTVKQQ